MLYALKDSSIYANNYLILMANGLYTVTVPVGYQSKIKQSIGEITKTCTSHH